MLDTLDRKIRQMHAALSTVANADLSTIRPEIHETETHVYSKMDFNADADEIALANTASLLIANIASIKDHLKYWCTRQDLPFHGDRLIDTTTSVALIHDLWNVDKHAVLKWPPRSGHTPKLQDLRQALRLSTGDAAGSGISFSMDLRTGKVTTGATGGGEAQVSLVAQIVDENGNLLADFTTTCAEAVRAWEGALSAAGVPLP